VAETLADILGPVVDRMNANAAPGTPALALLIGPEFLTEHDAPPRVVWVPATDAYGDGTQHGTPGVRRDRKTVKSNAAVYAVHCWGRDYDGARTLRDALLVAAHEVAGASMDGATGEWLYGERGAWIQDGRVLVVRLTIAEPITAGPWTFAPVTDEAVLPPAGGAVPGDGNLDPTEP